MLSCSLIPYLVQEPRHRHRAGTDQLASGNGVFIPSPWRSSPLSWRFLGPIFGVLADHKDKKKGAVHHRGSLGIFGCILNGFITGWLLFLILFVHEDLLQRVADHL